MSRLLVLCLFVSGCSLYWGDDSGDDVCNYGYAGTAEAYWQRDPSTGVCSAYGGGGGGGCCGNDCAVPADTVAVPFQDWGACYTSCDSLDEASCKSTTGCQAAYLDSDLADQNAPSFVACWSTAPYDQSPQGTTCAQRDAYGCAQSDACSPVYTGTDGNNLKWEQCIAESSASCDLDCGVGSHCEQQCASCNSLGCSDTCSATCVPDVTCGSTDCGPGYQCVEQCDALVGPCDVTCVPTGTDPGTCAGTVTCNQAAPSCPANTTAGVANGCWTGFCIPNADCGTHDPGQCYDQVTCNSAPPACPMGTLPGITNDCYSGYCVPTYGCEIAACETLSTEAACEGRSDCSAVYQGNDCTCDSFSNCTCQTETYEKCQSLYMPL